MGLKDYFKGFFDVMEEIDTTGEIETAVKWIGEFYVYFDSLAAANPHRYHHVYEWHRVGNESARLFQLNFKQSGMGTIITYEFKESMVPNDNGVVFADKAEVMESGQIVEFYTELAVPIGEGEFRTGRFTFKPGGPQTTGAFGEAFMLFFSNKMLEGRSANLKIVPKSYTKMAGMADGRKVYDSIINK